MDARHAIHELVDDLPEGKLRAARQALESLREQEDDPLLRLLENAPADDEPSSPEEDASCKEAWEEYKRGESKPLEQYERERDL